MCNIELAETMNQCGSNNTCHPNPTAMVGNRLTGGGNVIEVVKVR